MYIIQYAICEVVSNNYVLFDINCFFFIVTTPQHQCEYLLCIIMNHAPSICKKSIRMDNRYNEEPHNIIYSSKRIWFCSQCVLRIEKDNYC